MKPTLRKTAPLLFAVLVREVTVLVRADAVDSGIRKHPNSKSPDSAVEGADFAARFSRA